MIRAAFVIALLALALPAHAQQYSYTYRSDAEDVPMSALASGSGLSAWASTFENYARSVTPAIGTCALTDTTPIPAGSVVTRSCAFGSGPTLSVKIRTPTTITASRPAIFVLSAWGVGANETVGAAAAADGYVAVEVSYQDWYSALAPLYPSGGYLPVWGRVAARIMDQVDAVLPAHDGYSVISSATGSLVAPFFVTWRTTQPRAIVTNGVLLSLDWLRRNYRYPGLPNIWDIGYVGSFTPVYLTMAPTPTQWQMGTTDAFWPDLGPLPPSGPFVGTDRGQTSDEAYGQFLVLQRGWSVLGGATTLHTGTQGHLEPDYAAAIAFIAAH